MERERVHAVTIHVVQDMIDYIEANLLETLTPQAIARQFFLSLSAMNTLFKIVCDMGVMEYVRNRRLTLAGQALLATGASVIDTAYQAGYETPEAFSKAFARFHGFPPGLVRRTFPKLRAYEPLRIEVRIRGGWERETNQCPPGQDTQPGAGYNGAIQIKGGNTMTTGGRKIHLGIGDVNDREYAEILCSLAQALDTAGIAFKADGKASLFAHGLAITPDKIGLTFLWQEEQRILDWFDHAGQAQVWLPGFKYFDAAFDGMTVRCMFYGGCPGDDTREFLYRNTDEICLEGQWLRAQSVDFYVQNAQPGEACYDLAVQWLEDHKQ